MTRDGNTQVYPASEHAARWQGLLLLVLGLLGELARDYNSCGCASKALGVPVYIVIPEPPWFYDGVLLVYKVA